MQAHRKRGPAAAEALTLENSVRIAAAKSRKVHGPAAAERLILVSFAPNAENQGMSGIISYKCPNCGGPLKFNPQKQKYACEYCLSEFAQEALMNEEEKTQEEKKESAVQPETLLYTCPSCGAELVTDSTTAASFCYYCHNPVILSGRLSGEFQSGLCDSFFL